MFPGLIHPRRLLICRNY
nr:unnamed protein product [Callosobruchus analis]